ALAGRPHAGPLPADLVAHIEGLGKLTRWVVDRLRQEARILEPDQRIDPYLPSWKISDDLKRTLTQLRALLDRAEFARGVENLLRADTRGHDATEVRTQILLAALNRAPCVGEEFARRILDETIQVYDRRPETDRSEAVWPRRMLLEPGLFVAVHFGLPD